MNIALLIISSASLVCSAGCLCILIKGAKEAQAMKSDVEDFKTKTNKNIGIVKTALSEMEI